MKTETDKLHGEGGRLVHGRLVMKNFDRGDLFTPDLDQKLVMIICNACTKTNMSTDMSLWRSHCKTHHSGLPGYSVRKVSSDAVRPGSVKCPGCGLGCESEESMEDHRHSQMRCVRLVCGQCSGLYSDLEQHMITDHGHDSTWPRLAFFSRVKELQPWFRPCSPRRPRSSQQGQA